MAVDARGLHKSFGVTHAVDDTTLQIAPGEIVALLGQNGAGKSTLIDLLLGLQHADAGTVRLFGLSPREAIRRSLVGVVHQSGALLPDYTVTQLLRMFAATHVAPLPIDRVLAQTDLEGLAKRRIGKLSGGEQQRVRLALALLPDPVLLVLDEPTAGMDAVARRHFWELMGRQAEAGRTIIFATHYLAEAQDFAERTVIVRSGRVVADAPTDDLRRQYAHRTLSISIDEGDAASVVATLRGRPGSSAWEVDTVDGRLVVKGADLDDAARTVLAFPGAHGLELVNSSLEDVFTALTEGAVK